MGYIIAILTSLLCDYLAMNFLEDAVIIKDKVYLIGYPIFLFYSAFVLITLF